MNAAEVAKEILRLNREYQDVLSERYSAIKSAEHSFNSRLKEIEKQIESVDCAHDVENVQRNLLDGTVLVTCAGCKKTIRVEGKK